MFETFKMAFVKGLYEVMMIFFLVMEPDPDNNLWTELTRQIQTRKGILSTMDAANIINIYLLV